MSHPPDRAMRSSYRSSPPTRRSAGFPALPRFVGWLRSLSALRWAAPPSRGRPHRPEPTTPDIR
ncbi:hypothetical protein RVR_10552 [Actinacidiphila reveromycinica]|uniref:Uncharacterized protein n=1 Tax=Actinacidiphila reveromycinica TaxID=659352 RepID=A0A7U3V0F2_9ACTN|nr:hypothetical protein RVR_10552 [Streptomyces sp. SN-593]